MAEFEPKGLDALHEQYPDQGVLIADIIDTERKLPPQTPFQEASVLIPDVVMTPIPIEEDEILGENNVTARPQPPPFFFPFGRTVRLAPPAFGPMIKPVLLVQARNHAQSVTITSLGTAAAMDVGFLSDTVHVFPPIADPVVPPADWQFAAIVTVAAGAVPYTLTLPSNTNLWGIQYTAVAQNVCLTVGAHLVAE